MLLLMKKRCLCRIFRILRQGQTLSGMKPETQHMAPGSDRRKVYNPHREGHVRILYSKQKILRQIEHTA